YSQVKVNEKLYEILLEQRELSKIQLSENSPTISVLDRARVPSIRSSPQRTLIVVASFGFSLIMAIFMAATAEYFARLRKSSPEQYLMVQSFIAAYFGWLPGVKKKSSQ
ncbi:MAG: GNVR domain-containing protein, partial [candidate division Zixibacteria bacterium]